MDEVRAEGHHANNSGTVNGFDLIASSAELLAASRSPQNNCPNPFLKSASTRQPLHLTWKGQKPDVKLKEKFVPTAPRSRLFSLPNFGAGKTNKPLFTEVGSVDDENQDSWGSLARKAHSSFASSKVQQLSFTISRLNKFWL